MAHLRAPMPSDVLFSTDNVGGEQKTKKGLHALRCSVFHRKISVERK